MPFMKFLLSPFKSIYPDWRWLAPIAIVVAHLLVVFQEDKTWWEMWFLSPYWVAFFASVAIAMVVMLGIIRVSVWLDFDCPWNFFRQRFWKQLVWGVGWPVVLSVAMATVYYALLEYRIHDTLYFYRYLQQIVLLILFFNACLYALWVGAFRFRGVYKRELRSAFVRDTQKLDNANIAYFYTKDGSGWAMGFNGKEEVLEMSLERKMLESDFSVFYQMRRDFIVNRNAVTEVLPIKRRLLKVVLCDGKVVPVSQRELATFKKWLLLTNR